MWEMSRKSINGIINKANISNIQNIVLELFNENLLRFKGLLCEAIMKAQGVSNNFTHIYSALISVLNSKFSEIGMLIIHRYLKKFMLAYKTSNRIKLQSISKMICSLINQEVITEFVGFEILTLLMEKRSEDSIELACDIMKQIGKILEEKNPSVSNTYFEFFRNLLHDGNLHKKTEYAIEALLSVRKSDYKNYSIIYSEELDLVEDEDIITHAISLLDEFKIDDILNTFQYDINYEKNERDWLEIKAEILEEDKMDMKEEEIEKEIIENQIDTNLNDYSEKDLKNLRKTIALNLISCITHDEMCHKLLKLKYKNIESEVANILIDSCIQGSTYIRTFGLASETLCLYNEKYKINFESQFEEQYMKIHGYNTNQIRNISKLFSHLLYSNAINWKIFQCIKLNEEDTTSSGRIFFKCVILDLANLLGNETLYEYITIHYSKYFSGILNKDTPKNIRFSINFFISIGLGLLSKDLAEYLDRIQKMVEEKMREEIMMNNNIEDENNSRDSDSVSYYSK